MSETLAFYRELLGFEITASWEEDGTTIWAEVSRDGPTGKALLWFFAHGIESRPGPAFSGVLYLFLGNIDAWVERLGGRLSFAWGPEVQAYGLKELAFEDPNGYLVCLAEDVD